MDNQLSIGDIRQYYQGSLILHKGKPVFVERVHDHRSVMIRDIRTGHTSDVPFNEQDFQNPAFRLGMVNIQGTVLWTSRQPIRRFSVGINNNNFCARFAEKANRIDPHRLQDALYKVNDLRCSELADCIEGIYPGFNSAYEQAMAIRGIIAFDKQFAIAYDGDLIYKLTTVGKVKPDDNISEDVFIDKYKYLNQLLGNRYEKGN